MSVSAPPLLQAVIPAAGLSRRMGQSKPLLTLSDRPIILRIIEQLNHPAIVTVWITIRDDDEPLAACLDQSPTKVLRCTHQLPDMKSTVIETLHQAQLSSSFDASHGWLLVTCDHPIIRADTLHGLVETWKKNSTSIVVPTYNGRRGHPTLFPAGWQHYLPEIPADQGINWIVRSSGLHVQEFATEDPSILWDIDTPAEYERIKSEIRSE